MSGTLYVVATPIGNLEDITLRALRILREVAVVAAEDTRRTARLLVAHGIATRTVSFHEHNTRARLPHLLARLANHESVALVTDAGTPGISDPGLELVQACIERGFPVDPIPGASAPLVALMASGLPMLPFTVFGFAPHRSKDRINWLSMVSKTPHTFSFFDSPLRIHATMVEAGKYLVNRHITVGRELTKSHQEFVRAVAGSPLFGHIAAKGEITVIVGPAGTLETEVRPLPTDAEVVREFGQLTDPGLSRRERTRLIGAQLGVSQRFVYAALERGLRIGRSTE